MAGCIIMVNINTLAVVFKTALIVATLLLAACGFQSVRVWDDAGNESRRLCNSYMSFGSQDTAAYNPSCG